MDVLSRIALILAVTFAGLADARAYSGPWCKVQTHVHSFRDDGKTHPEVALAYYRALGYKLTSLTHHWPEWQTHTAIQWAHDGGSLDAANQEYVRQLPDRMGFGDSGDGGGTLYALPSHDEMKAFFELELPSQVPDGGVMFVTPGQEMTPSGAFTRGHVLGLGLAAPVTTVVSGASYAVTYDASVQRLRDAGVAPESGITEPITIIAHPNWYDAGIAVDFRHLDVQGIEIYSGHSHTLPHGGGPSQMSPPAVRVTWDQINQWRITQGLPLVWGFASDDMHDHYALYPTSPHRAWIEVECDASPTEAELLLTIEAGGFFATTGVELSEYTVSTGAGGETCLTVTPADSRARVTVLGILRDTTPPVPWRVVTSARGGVSNVCPNRGTFGLARVEIFDTRGRKAWTQHVQL